MDNRIYLLTGASGLLGRNILNVLISKEANVRALVRNPAGKHMPQGVDVVAGDLLDPDALERFFRIPDGLEVIVIHAAGIVTMDPRPNDEVRRVNVDGTAGIIQKCIERKVEKLVYVSSTSAIPERPVGERIYETYFHDAEKVVGYYSKTKAEATELVMKAIHEQGLDASVVYPSGILGPNDENLGLITSSIKLFASGKMRIAIGGTFNAADVRDLAEGIIACAERGRKGETYIMSGQCYTFRAFLDTICNEAGVKKPLATVPLWLLRPFTFLGVLYGKLKGQPPWLSGYTIYNLVRNNDFSAEKAERELGYHCRPLHETIRDTIEWLRRR